MGCIDHFLTIFWGCIFILWLPWKFQGPCILIQFMLVFFWLGEIPPPKLLHRNLKTRMRHIYFNVRRMFDPEGFPRHHKHIRRKKLVKLGRFRRRRMAYHMVHRCCRRRFVDTPALDGRFVPTQRSRRHRRWKGRNNKARHRHWVRRVVNHEFFLNNTCPLRDYGDMGFSKETSDA